jgi:phospholipid/cholesterol/gamma-HCH transport system substrate-binding protein
MTAHSWSSRLRIAAALGTSMVLLTSGCAWQGLNSLPLPGAVGRGKGNTLLHVEMANIGSLESNSPVMIDDVVVGSVGTIVVDNWHANLQVWVRNGVAVPANAVATVGQTSLLGSSHLQLAAPLGIAPQGEIHSGATIPMDRTSTYPSTEQTLSSLSVVLNSGGLGQIDEVIKEFSAALGGRGNDIRDLVNHLNDFVGTLDDQTQDLVSIMEGMKTLATQVNNQSDVVESTLKKLPAALKVLIAERSNITTALDRLRVFSDTTTAVVNDAKDNLIKDLQNLQPSIQGLADAGPTIGKGLQEATVFPFAQWVVDDAIKGDYANLYTTIDLTTSRVRTDLLAGTRWGRYTQGVPDLIGNPPPPWQHTQDPLGAPMAPPPDAPPASAPGREGTG